MWYRSKYCNVAFLSTTTKWVIGIVYHSSEKESRKPIVFQKENSWSKGSTNIWVLAALPLRQGRRRPTGRSKKRYQDIRPNARFVVPSELYSLQGRSRHAVHRAHFPPFRFFLVTFVAASRYFQWHREERQAASPCSRYIYEEARCPHNRRHIR